MGLLTGYLLKRRLGKVRPYLRGRILDLGCADGALLSCLSPGQSYTGVEVRADLVEALQTRYPSQRFIAADLDEGCPALSEGDYDTVVMCAVIEHLHNPDALLDRVAAALAQDGRLALTTPTPFGDRLLHAGTYLGLFNRGPVEEHARLYGKDDLTHMLGEHGFTVEVYGTFEFGLNQLVVARRAGSS